jgi:hypothetical protein
LPPGGVGDDFFTIEKVTVSANAPATIFSDISPGISTTPPAGPMAPVTGCGPGSLVTLSSPPHPIRKITRAQQSVIGINILTRMFEILLLN